MNGTMYLIVFFVVEIVASHVLNQSFTQDTRISKYLCCDQLRKCDRNSNTWYVLTILENLKLFEMLFFEYLFS